MQPHRVLYVLLLRMHNPLHIEQQADITLQTLLALMCDRLVNN